MKRMLCFLLALLALSALALSCTDRIDSAGG